MSPERPQQSPKSDADPATLADDAPSSFDVDAFQRALGDTVLAIEEHVHAPAIQVRPDTMQSSLSAPRDDLGLDHLSCVTAQKYEDRYESVYHLKSYDNPTREVSVVIPTLHSDPVSESAAPVLQTTKWHEREAYNPVGIQCENHPDLRRILLPETW